MIWLTIAQIALLIGWYTVPALAALPAWLVFIPAYLMVVVAVWIGVIVAMAAALK